MKAVVAPSFLPEWAVAYAYPHNVNSIGMEMTGCEDTFWGDHCAALPLPVFPTPLYEVIVCGLFSALLWAIRKRLRVPGMLFAVYLLLNGFERFWIEKIRVNEPFLGSITQAEVISGLLSPNVLPDAILSDHPDRLRVLWVDSANPVNTAADTARVLQAMAALDLMVVCVEAGLGLNAALHRVGREMELVDPNLSEELAVTNREIRAGKPRDEALRNLGDRTGVDDVKSLVAMLVQTDRFGTSIADSLRVFADSMRTKRRQRAEEMVAKAAIKLIFPLLLFIFPALLIVLMGPALIRIYELFGAIGAQ